MFVITRYDKGVLDMFQTLFKGPRNGILASGAERGEKRGRAREKVILGHGPFGQGLRPGPRNVRARPTTGS